VRQNHATLSQLEALYRSRFAHFVRVATAICRDADRGRDAVQAAFVTAVRERRSFRASGPLEAWVWRIVVHEARRVAREPRAPVLAHVEEQSSNGRGDDPFGIRAWIAALPERQRETVFLRYYADLDYRAIALVLGVELGTVSATLAAAHRSLRNKFEDVRQ
jgi:RNA polymerase sigma factor (sigma-70 family)